MRHIMNLLRTSPPETVHDRNVVKITYYRTSEIGLPKSDVIKLIMENGLSAVVRPSGTEPKLKLHLFAVGKTALESKAVIGGLADWFTSWIGDRSQ